MLTPRHGLSLPVLVVMIVALVVGGCGPNAPAGARGGTGIVVGRVANGAGGGLVDAGILATPLGGQETLQEGLLTGEGGWYRVTLGSGPWDITVAKDGFEPQTQRIDLQPGEVVLLDFTLRVD